MSASIDEKVVRLKLENAGFKAGITSAISSLKNLSESLKMKGGVKGLEGVKTAASKVNFSEMQNGIEQTSSKFSMLEGIATVALGNIAAKFAMIGGNAVKSLTLDGVIDGFREYELQLNSVQTILANTKSKGETIKTVNSALDDLNTYADKTIYNFGQMTSNIGLFTAAGVGLKESVGAIKGLSNLAAASGVGATEASRAMYQLSQAIASGTVKLMDWNSIQTAGLGGDIFKNALMDTARAHGVAVDSMVAKHGTFRESLSEGWLTADIMNETLMLMTDEIENLSDAELLAKGYTQENIDQMRDFAKTAEDAATKVKTFTQLIDTVKEAVGSGWAQTWRILVGDLEQAREFWTPISNAINGFIDRMSASRNAIAQAFVDAGGRTKVIETLGNLFKAVANPLKAIKEGFDAVFSGPSGEALADTASKVADFTKKLLLSEESLTTLKNASITVFSALKTVLNFLKAVGAGVFGVFKAFSPIFRPIISLLKAFVRALAGASDTMSSFEGSFSGVSDGISDGAAKISQALSTIKTIVKDTFSGWLDSAEKTKEDTDSLGNKLSRLAKVFEPITSLFKSTGDSIGKMFNNGDLLPWAYLILIGTGIYKAFTKIKDVFSDMKGGFGLSDLFDSVKGVVDSFAKKNMAKTLLIGAGALAILAGSLWLLSKVPGDKVATVSVALGVIVAAMVGLMKGLDVVKVGPGLAKKLFAVVVIALALGVVAAALAPLGRLDQDGMERAMAAMIIMSGVLIGVSQLVNKLPKPSKSAVATFVVYGAIAYAISGLGKTVAKLGEMDLKSLGKGTAATSAILAALGLFQRFAGGKKPTGFLGGTGYVMMAFAIYLIGKSVSKLGELDLGTLAKGVGAAGAIMLAMGVMSRISSSTSGFSGFGNAAMFVATGYALKEIGQVIMDLASLDLSSGYNAVAMMGLIMAELTAAIFFMQKSGGGFGAAATVGALGYAVGEISNAIKLLGEMPIEDAAQGVGALGVILAELVVAMRFMQGGVLSGGAIALVATSMDDLAEALKKFSEMNWQDAAQGLITMGVGLAIIVGAGKMAQGAAMGLFTLSMAMVAIGGGVALFALGLKLISEALTSMSTIPIAGIVTGIIALVVVIAVFAAMVYILAPIAPLVVAVSFAFLMFAAGLWLAAEAFETVANTFIGIIQAIIAVSSDVVSLLSQFGELILTMFNGLVEAVISLLSGLANVITSLLSGIADSIVTILQGAADAVSTVIQSIGDAIGTVAESVGNAVSGVFDSASGLVDSIKGLLETVASTVDSLVTSLGRLGTELPKAGQGVKTFVDTVSEVSLIDTAKAAAVAKAMGDMADPLTNFGNAANVAKTGSAGLVNILVGLVSGLTTMSTSISGIGTGVSSELTAVSMSIASAAPMIGSGMIIIATTITNGSTMISTSLSSVSRIGTGSFTLLAAAIQVGGASVSAAFTTTTMAVARFVAVMSLQMNNVVNVFKMGATAATQAVRSMSQAIQAGMSSASTAAASGIASLSHSIVGGLRSLSGAAYSAGYSVGANIVSGVTNGINANRSAAISAAGSMATAALNQAKANLAIHSPSREFYKVGNFIDQGMANGISENADAPIGAVRSLSQSVMSTADKILGDTLDDFNPTITPVIDSSELRKGASDISKIFGSRSVGFGRLSGDAQLVAASRNNSSQNSSANGTSGGVNNYINYTQNNTSPRALDDYEIYRQTRRQVESLKRSLRDK